MDIDYFEKVSSNRGWSTQGIKKLSVKKTGMIYLSGALMHKTFGLNAKEAIFIRFGVTKNYNNVTDEPDGINLTLTTLKDSTGGDGWWRVTRAIKTGSGTNMKDQNLCSAIFKQFRIDMTHPKAAKLVFVLHKSDEELANDEAVSNYEFRLTSIT